MSNNYEEIQALLQEPSFKALKNFVWNLRAPNKQKHFLWQALSGTVPVNERLLYRHIGREGECPRCGQDETINHMLFTCPPAKQTWALAGTPAGSQRFPFESLGANIHFLFSKWKGSTNVAPVYPWIAWYIWKARNDKLFQGIDRSPMETKDMAEGEAEAWSKSQYLLQTQQPVLILGETEHDRREQEHETEVSCYIDGSWKQGDTTIGVGWLL